MKSAKYLLISLFAFCFTLPASACWEAWYPPRGYYIYRVYDKKANENFDASLSQTDRICLSWQEIVPKSIPADSIRRVVFHSTLSELEEIVSNPKRTYQNPFTEWLTKHDREALDYLFWAKINEDIRTKRNSPWYYPTMRMGSKHTLEEVIEKSLSVKSARLRDRYLLQAVRSLFTMGEYERCIALWEEEISHLDPTNLMRQISHNYIAGARFRLNQTEEAMAEYALIGDITSLMYCSNELNQPLNRPEAFALICRANPNNPMIPSLLQEIVNIIEPKEYYYEEPNFQVDDWFLAIEQLCTEMVRHPKCKNRAMWHYTAACLADMKGESYRAHLHLQKAEQAAAPKVVEESVMLFRIYLDAKLQPYTKAYEERLYAQLKWLDEQIVSNLDPEIRLETSRRELTPCYSFYYWNDMLRRILLAEVCPRMLQAGKAVRAIQLANMADNRLYGLVNERTYFDFIEVDGHYKWAPVKRMTMKQYRYDPQAFNSIDYSNHFFELIDSLGADTAIAYAKNVATNPTPFDRFLNARGYTNSDYLNDIVGTQCLRQMRYKEALHYLRAVSASYQYHHNLGSNTELKPTDFRYDFAAEMVSLEAAISTTSNPDILARKRYRFAVKLRDSFGCEWRLTQYYKGEVYWGRVGEKRDWESDRHTRAAMRRYDELMKQVFALGASDETKAELLYEMSRYRTIATRYGHTKIGQLVRGSCDTYIDHQPSSEKQL
ncbi:MAG: hypothetical protein IIV06_06165 [Alistipes sp.]|nr:hypothetical protein [Alistipes sp.]